MDEVYVTGKKTGIGLCQECRFMNEQGLCRNIDAPRVMLNDFVNYPWYGCGLQEPKPGFQKRTVSFEEAENIKNDHINLMCGKVLQ